MAKRAKPTKTGSGNQKPAPGEPGGGSGDNADDELGEGEETEGEEGDESSDDDNAEGGEVQIDQLPASAQKYIRDLRKENAKHRTKANKAAQDYEALSTRVKGLAGDEDESSPEEQVGFLGQQNQSLAFENATLRIAVSNGIGDEDSLEYFQFLVAKAAGELEDGEELGAEELDGLVKKVKGKFGAAGGKATSTGVATKTGDGKQKPGKSSDTVTVERFVKMGMSEKTALYQKNPELYAQLFEEAKDKRLLITRR